MIDFSGQCRTGETFLKRIRNFLLLLGFTAALGQAAMAQSGTWTPLTNQPSFGAGTHLLLTDGTVLCQDAGQNDWWKLTPDQNGSYINGTWTQAANLPSGYGPLYFASAVLADGKVIVIGGEYNFDVGDWINLGALYDPVADTWTPVTAPDGGTGNWANIGDAESVVLPDNRFILSDPFGTEMAAFNELTLDFTDIASTGKADGFDEEGWTLLPNGTFITCDAVDAPNTEIYTPSGDLAGAWNSAGSTPNSLEDPGSEELGPQVLRYNGTLFAMGATQYTAVYNLASGTWSAGPNFAIVNSQQLDIADGAACVLPDDNVLYAASPGVYNIGSYFYEFDGTKMNAVNNPPNAPGDSSYYFTLLMLPTGQVMETDQSQDVEIYTPNGSANPAWAPTVTQVSSTISQGSMNNLLKGTQLNGLSTCNAYGDDEQDATNYPIVKITNNATGHVFYCRTHDHSTMGIATGSTIVTTEFDVPSNLESGPSMLQVVTNGIASAGVPVGTFIKSMAMAPASVTGGVSSTGTISLVSPAPTGGISFALSSSSSSASVPAQVTVPVGKSSITFVSTTTAVDSTTTAQIVASYQGSAVIANLTINPASLSLVKIVPTTSILGGLSTTGEVVLNGKAGPSGVVVSVSSSNTSVAMVSPSLSISAGQNYGTFPIETSAVSTSTPVTITATLGSVNQTATLTVTPATLSSSKMIPTSVSGGAIATGEVILNGNAGPGGTVVYLSSNNEAVAPVPASVTVPAGLVYGTYKINTTSVNSTATVTITATLGSNHSVSTLTVTPPTLTFFDASPGTVNGGGSTTGQVYVNQKTGSSGLTVTISSNNSAVQVPSSVTIAAGTAERSFTITTSPVSSSTVATINATLGSVTLTSSVTVQPAVVTTVKFIPTSIKGGTADTGEVVLNGKAGPSGTVVLLSSGTPGVASVPSSVTVPAGQDYATFKVVTTAVTTSTNVTVTATTGSSQVSGVLTVTPN